MHEVKFFSTTRYLVGGSTTGNYANFNLATHTGDNWQHVHNNRVLLKQKYQLPNQPLWLNQTHSNICLDDADTHTNADAIITQKVAKVLAIFTADCLPIFAFDTHHTTVGVAHTGWKGLYAGVIDNFIASFTALGIAKKDLIIHFGTALSQANFQVNIDFVRRFVYKDNIYLRTFVYAKDGKPLTTLSLTNQTDEKFLFDIYDAAMLNLQAIGIKQAIISPVDRAQPQCTYDSNQLFSYRRDGRYSGRQAHIIYLSKHKALNQ